MKNAISLLLIALMIVSLCGCAVVKTSAAEAITIVLKRDLTTNGIYLRANMAHNGQTMIIAQYRDNTLKWVNVTPVDNVEGYSCDTAICTDYQPTDVFKGFLWDSLSSAKPALNCIESQAKYIETPALWLDAADVSTVTLSENGTVMNWADKSGSGRDVYQETLANQPKYEQGQYININDSGAVTYLENRSPIMSKSNVTVFLMAELDKVYKSGDSYHYIDEGSTKSQYPSFALYGDKNGGHVNMRNQSKTSVTVDLANEYWGTGNQLHIYTDDKSSIAATVYRSDKTIAVTPQPYKNPLISDTYIDIFSIGARKYHKSSTSSATVAYPTPCKYKEILIYDRILTDQEKQEVQDYLLKKWELTPAVSDGSGDNASLTPNALTAVSIAPDSIEDTQKAYYYVPSDALDMTKEPVPLVVGLHSWSETYAASTKSTFAELAKENGWAMIHPDFRGSNEKPSACASEDAVDDIVRAVEFMKKNANIDSSRIYLVGASGGGHMALSAAARRPEIWAAVSAWVPITDLAQWYNFSKSKNSKYYSMIAKCCGGAPGTSDEIDAEYYLRSPINHLQNAINIPLDINTGIHDGHTGSVPISHALNAFNKLAQSNGNADKMLTDEEISYMTAKEKIPEGIDNETVDLSAENRSYAVHFRRTAGNARITVFEGGHTMEFKAAFKFFEDKVKIN